MANFRFLHAADIHLDSPLRGLAGQEGNAAERVRTATREALDQLITLAIDETVDFLIIAGDLYDGDWRDFNTGLYFIRQMGRLNEAGIPVYLLHGNHDAASQITRRLELPSNVHVFDTRKPETIVVRGLPVVLHGQSFRQRDVSDNLALHYPGPVPDTFNIGVLHTGLGGMGGHANYAPCSLNDLVNKGYDYWALGHVHQNAVLHENPHVVFPGNLQGRHIRETGPKGAYLITVEGGAIEEITPLACDVVRWAELVVNVSEVTSLGGVTDQIHQTLQEAVTTLADGRLLACRVVLNGTTEAHPVLLAAEDQLLADTRAHALGIGDEVAWIEKVVIGTQASVDADTLAQREDAIGELQRMLLGEAAADEELVKLIESDIGELVRRLPPDISLVAEDPVLKAAVEGNYAALIEEVSPYLSSRLLAQGD